MRIFAENDVLVQNERGPKSLPISKYSGARPFAYGEYRHLGMIGALELVEDKNFRKAFDWQGNRLRNIQDRA